jgi:serine/threonine-protein kinase SRK2
MENYELIRSLGRGSYGTVSLYKNTETNELEAIKFIKRGENVDDEVIHEITNHMYLKHPYIIRFNKVFLTTTHICIAMEYGNEGELFRIIQKSGSPSEDEARVYFQQLILAVEYCHKHNIAHRDIKLENILLTTNDNGKHVVKLCDFGLSTKMFNGRAGHIVGTLSYVAPEMIINSKSYDGRKSDVWSCAVTLYAMLFGSYPFEDPKHPNCKRKTMERIVKAELSFSGVTEDCADLLRNMFQKSPSMRYGIDSIKKHPWFLKGLEKVCYDKNEYVLTPRQSFEEIIDTISSARLTEDDYDYSLYPIVNQESERKINEMFK